MSSRSVIIISCTVCEMRISSDINLHRLPKSRNRPRKIIRNHQLC
uniref:Uncharacterized protein n=1 Tax=Arundo donax TaxID=35708 RepID=A0A0A9H849_ARUDO